jgi:hypothetical protein
MSAGKYIIYILLIFTIFITCCDSDEDEEVYNFKVMSSNGSATGYYSVNGGAFQYFDTIAGSSSFYNYEQTISSLDTILIYAEGDTTAATAISIYLYRDTELIKTVSASQSDSAIPVNVTLDYSGSDE